MLNNEKLAIAAHLHVVLRRKTGRVTDTEWMATNAEYAAEIVRFARASVLDDGPAELAEWAAKLEQAMVPAAPSRPTRESIFGALFTGSRGSAANVPSPPDALIAAIESEPHQYVRGIR